RFLQTATCLTLLVLAAFSPQRAAAQAPAPAPATVRRAPPAAAGTLAETLTGSAKQDYEAGRVLFEDQDYAGALLKFQHAFETTPDPRLLWNMAACEKSARNYASALALLERYRKQSDLKLSEAQRGE